LDPYFTNALDEDPYLTLRDLLGLLLLDLFPLDLFLLDPPPDDNLGFGDQYRKENRSSLEFG